MAAIDEMLAQVARLQEAGNAAGAEQLCLQILQADPTQPEALFRLGTIANFTGRPALAVQSLQAALERQPQNHLIHANLGHAFYQLGQREEAAACYRRAVELRPEFVDVHFFLGPLLRELGQLDQAEACLRHVLKLRPTNAGGHNDLGKILLDRGRLQEAREEFEQAARLKPDLAVAQANLGSLLLRLGRLAEAEPALRQAVRLDPSKAAFQNCLGEALAGQGKTLEAIACFETALRLQAADPLVHNNLGKAFINQDQLDRAEASFREALRLQPDFLNALNNLGTTLCYQGKLDESLAIYEEALRLEPRFASAHSNYVMNLCYDPAAAPEAIFAEHCRWDAAHAYEPLPPPGNDRNPKRRLRVGYVSADFRPQFALCPFLAPIIKQHDRAQVEVYCYPQALLRDAVAGPFRKLCKGWHCIGDMPDDQAAEQIRRDRIDILVDLAGQSANNRLRVFTYKPAPVQVTYLGYPATTGLKAIDYRLTDAVADPPGESIRHSEQLVRLPGAFFCYQPQYAVPDPGPLPVDRKGAITLGSLHTLSKLNGQVLDLWSALLRALPAARLLIFRNTLTGKVKDELRDQFTNRGIAADRLDLRHQTAAGQTHWHVYKEIDLSLDPFPWTGHTTSCESLWMGVPVVTLRGNRHSGRMAASTLTGLGLTNWIAETPEQYVELAVAKAKDLDGLRELRASLRDRFRASPLYDAKKFTRGLEAAYRQMWMTWCGA